MQHNFYKGHAANCGHAANKCGKHSQEHCETIDTADMSDESDFDDVKLAVQIYGEMYGDFWGVFYGDFYGEFLGEFYGEFHGEFLVNSLWISVRYFQCVLMMKNTITNPLEIHAKSIYKSTGRFTRK